MDYRKIETAQLGRRVPKDQPAPMLQWIAVADLVIDDRYQRPLGPSNWKQIRKIADEFHWSRFTPVLVAPIEDGKFAIIDGQHRTHAAAVCGYDTVPAMAVLMSRAEQASAFAWVNGNVTKVTGFHIFKAAVAAGDKWAVEASDLVARAGCRLMPYNSSAKAKRPGEVYCISLIREFIDSGRGEIAELALSAIWHSDVSDCVEMYANRILRPWFCAVADDRAFQGADLRGFVNAVDLVDLMDRVAMIRKAPPYNTQSAYIVAKAAISAKLAEFMRTGAADRSVRRALETGTVAA